MEGEGEGCVLTRLSTSSSAESHRQYYNDNSPKQHAPIRLATPQRAKPRAMTRISMHMYCPRASRITRCYLQLKSLVSWRYIRIQKVASPIISVVVACISLWCYPSFLLSNFGLRAISPYTFIYRNIILRHNNIHTYKRDISNTPSAVKCKVTSLSFQQGQRQLSAPWSDPNWEAGLVAS